MEQPFILVDERADFDLDKHHQIVRLTMHSADSKVRVAMSANDLMMLAAAGQRFCRGVFAQQQDADIVPFTVIGRV